MVLMYDLLQQNLMGQGHPGAFEWLLSWANRRAATICEWLQRQYAALEAEHPAELAELKGIQAPRELEFVSTRGRFGEALPPESVCRLQCQGTLLPPDSVLAERALVYWVAALARAVDGEFQRRVQRVVAEYETMHNAEVRPVHMSQPSARRRLRRMASHLRRSWSVGWRQSSLPGQVRRGRGAKGPGTDLVVVVGTGGRGDAVYSLVPLHGHPLVSYFVTERYLWSFRPLTMTSQFSFCALC